MLFNKQNLLSELLDRTQLVVSNTQPFLRLTDQQLNYKPAPDKWSIAEIFEHLNITHQVYIDCILSKITRAADSKNGKDFKSTWLGDWLYEKIMPRPDGTIFKMKARKILHAKKSSLDAHQVLNCFLQQQDTIHDIIRYVSTKDIQAIKIPLSYSRLFTLRLGDNLRFIIAHNERHLRQAQNMLHRHPENTIAQ